MPTRLVQIIQLLRQIPNNATVDKNKGNISSVAPFFWCYANPFKALPEPVSPQEFQALPCEECDAKIGGFLLPVLHQRRCFNCTGDQVSLHLVNLPTTIHPAS